jgi:hypothetical protein
MDMCLLIRGLYFLFYHSFETPFLWLYLLVGFLLSCGYSHMSPACLLVLGGVFMFRELSFRTKPYFWMYVLMMRSRGPSSPFTK